MGVFVALKNGFVTILKNLKLWVLLVVISIVVMVLSIPFLQLILGPDVFKPGFTPLPATPGQLPKINWAAFIPFMIIGLLLQVFINAGSLGSIRDIVRTGSLNLSNFVTHAKKFFARILIFGIVMILIMLLIGVVFSFLAAIAGAVGKAVAPIGVLLGVLLIICGLGVLVLVGTYGSIGPAVIVSEDRGIGDGLTTAYSFLKKKLWSSIGLAVLLWIIIAVVGLINNTITRQNISPGLLFPIQLLFNFVNILG